MSLLGRSIEIIRNHGLKGYLRAIQRYLWYRPVLDKTWAEIWWRVNRLPRSRPIVEVGVQGYRMLVDLSKKGIHKELFLCRCHEPESTRIFREMLPRDATVLDIGANIGYYVIMEAQLGHKVHAIEPEPENLALLRKNIELNQCGGRVQVYELAVSDTTGKAILSISDTPNHHRLRAPSDSQTGRCIEVATTSLDDFVEGKEIDVIRMDLEGGEWLAIKGMARILKSSKPLFLVIEVHPKLMRDYGGDALELRNLLLDSGFKMRHVAVTRPGFPFSLRGCIKAQARPYEIIIDCDKRLGHFTLDKHLERILDEERSYRVFMERQAGTQ